MYRFMESETTKQGKTWNEDRLHQLAGKHNGETRRKILHRLRGKVDFIGSIRRDLKKSWQTIHEHVNELEEDGLVERVSEGRRVNYTLTEKGEAVANLIPQVVE